ncbi:chlorophyll a/b-binding protein [Nodosilinea sp. E11]|uniref:chlorophyll a/b-binding protein n=1 Tax=Nodosilinea sp. E11 TaxID=3037479 RepID=UPI002934D384|nr:chlorophyll a/b-binding protein [Nodosilinea sp. E11]WOD39429.1 chlorophyll a/b-binding protein [Nodosilinea sp. E11]
MVQDSANSAPPNPEGSGVPPEPTPGFGWTRYAERINGRFAMVGFVALLLLELVTGQTFFSWLGLR